MDEKFPNFPPPELIYAEEWAVDAIDRLLLSDVRGAKTSLALATSNLLKLPPGGSYDALEEFIHTIGVKLSHNHGTLKP